MKYNDIKNQRIDLLKKYYPVDTVKKTVTIKLYYNHASELLDYTVGETGCEMFKYEFLDKISSLLNKLPVGYKADIILEIKNYDVYQEDIIMEKFNDLLAINSYDALRKTRRSSFMSAILIIIGCLILIGNALLTTFNVFSNNPILANVLYEAINIVSWVFIWQAVTLLFLSPSQQSQYLMNIFYNLNSFSIATEDKIVVSENNESLAQKCKIDSSISKAQKQILAISSTLLIFESFVLLLNTIITFATNPSDNTVYLFILEILLGLSTMLDGALALTKFTDRFIGNKKFIAFFGITIILMVVYFIIALLQSGDGTSIINQLFVIILLTVTFFLCFFWDTLGFRHTKKKHSK